MKLKTIVCAVIFFNLAISGVIYPEMQGSFSLINYYYGNHTLSNDLQGTSNKTIYGGGIYGKMIILPKFAYEDNFQFDAKLDCFFLKDFSMNLNNSTMQTGLTNMLSTNNTNNLFSAASNLFSGMNTNRFSTNSLNTNNTNLLDSSDSFSFSSNNIMDLGGMVENIINLMMADTLFFKINELYMDFLFFDTLSFKSGFYKVDYGYNGYFHPLNIIEFLPDLRKSAGRMSAGSADLGFKGVPSSKVKITIPEFFENLKINLAETVVIVNLEELEKNYFISDLSVVYGNLNFGLLSGYTKDKKANWGVALSYMFPFDILVFSELLLKRESFKPYVMTNGKVTNYRDQEYLNASLRVEYKIKETLLNNDIALSIEYFYFGEGLTKGMYDNTLKYLKKSSNNRQNQDKLLIAERNFRNNLNVNIGYSLADLKLGFNYKLIMSIDPFVFNHQFQLSKTYNAANIALAFNVNQSDEKYQIIYKAADMSGMLNLFVEF